MVADDPKDLLRRALQADDPSDSVYTLAVRLRDGGMKRPELEKLYTDELLLHRDSDDERKWDAIADTLDFVVGWCSPGKELYPEPTIVVIDWSRTRSIDEFYDAILPQCGSPSWHGRNLNALSDSWVTGGIDHHGPPFAFRFFAASHAPSNLIEFRDAVLEIARESVSENGGSITEAEQAGGHQPPTRPESI